ncbi:MAG: zinc ribbon domain-containing protein [Clostridiales bacterium]|nr:zinc ribbon domain-containing protein [Clostridiales bacterium]
MRFCTTCGHELPDEASTCPSCGAFVIKPAVKPASKSAEIAKRPFFIIFIITLLVMTVGGFLISRVAVRYSIPVYYVLQAVNYFICTSSLAVSAVLSWIALAKGRSTALLSCVISVTATVWFIELFTLVNILSTAVLG